MYKNPNKQSGFSLIEIMVAALVLSVGILGIAGLQIIGMKGTQQSFMKSQAMDIAHNMVERMRANRAGVITGKYVLNSADTTTFSCGAAICAGTTCDATEIAAKDKRDLVCGYGTGVAITGGTKANNGIFVGGGTLTVACNGAGNVCTGGEVKITINWNERAISTETAAARSITLEANIGAL